MFTKFQITYITKRDNLQLPITFELGVLREIIEYLFLIKF